MAKVGIKVSKPTVLKYLEINLRRIPPNSPEKNGRTERFHLSLKSEAFKNVVPLGVYQTQKVCREFQDYYNNYLSHQGIAGNIPNRFHSKSKNRIKFFKKEHLGGKITSLEPNFTLAA